MTLKKIAARTGVSVLTVSRITNSPGGSFTRREVRGYVWAIIKETDYMLNQNARAPKFRKDPPQEPSTGALACTLGRVRTIEDNPFLTQLTRVTEQRILEQGYPVWHSYSAFDVKTDVIPEKIEPFKANGVIVLGRFDGNYVGLLEWQYKSLIYMDRNAISVDRSQITCDGYEVAQTAMNYLIACGHRRTDYAGEISSEVRYQAYLDTLRENGLEYSRSLISDYLQNGVESHQGTEHLLKVVSPLPTAVFCTTNIVIIAALRRLTETKIKVPGQLSLISMDNTELPKYVSPMLATVGIPTTEIGNMTVQALTDKTQKRHKLLMEIFLPDKLTIRGSAVGLNEGMYT